VVENHNDTLAFYRLFLREGGHSVTEARTMHDALARLPEAPYDVLISDLGLPDGSGWELLDQLRERHQPLPPFAIAVSGYGTSSDAAKSRAAGYRYHLVKPFEVEALDALLKEAQRELAAS
jgi:CheY-like chemotaxis protein